MRPDNPAIVYGCQVNIEAFYKFELNQRQEMGFPPFSRLIRIVYRGKDGRKVLEALEELTQLFRQAGLPDVMGPAECPLGVISGNHRYHTLIRSEDDFSGIHRITASLLSHSDVPRGIYREIDIDPVQLL
jgi:primosomal protein N' (replication factor Y)